MSNIDRIAKLVIENGGKNILIHSVPGTQNWIVAQKIEENKWLITLCNPMKNTTYNLGIVNDAQHLSLWQELINYEIEKKTNHVKIAKELRRQIKNFLERSNELNNYAKFTKREAHKKTHRKSRRRFGTVAHYRSLLHRLGVEGKRI